MIKLKEVTINKYKVFTEPQTVQIEDDITAIVGLNESGKTAFLEALAKLNYFDEDPSYRFDALNDFPRSELKNYEGKIEDIEVLLCKFEITPEFEQQIATEIGSNTLISPYFYFGARYNNWQVWRDFDVDVREFLIHKLAKLANEKSVASFIKRVDNFEDIPNKIDIIENPTIQKFVMDLYNSISANSYNWDDNLKGYIAKKWFRPNLPKFWYFDDYYSLPSRININQLNFTASATESQKTATALFKLAKINIAEILQTDNFEQFIAELENTANIVTKKIYQYWSTNKNLELEFEIEIEKHTKESGRFFKTIEEYEERYLNIRIRDKYDRVSLPLERRSRGFNWFFSFIVWFSQIENENSNYILLLDEPGLSLHAVAQTDLLRFLRKLSNQYQLLFSTHSPFMINSDILPKVRTISINEKENIISNINDETDNNTLFPTQVAIGYEIAQNLMIHQKNLLVHQISDFMLLKSFSDFLQKQNKTSLSKTIAISPIGGLSNVLKFILLMSGYNLNMKFLAESCNITNTGTNTISEMKKNINFLSIEKIIECNKPEISLFDLFSKEDFEKHFSTALEILEFEEKPYLNGKTISEEKIFEIISNLLAQPITTERFSEETLLNFELLFEQINKEFEEQYR